MCVRGALHRDGVFCTRVCVHGDGGVRVHMGVSNPCTCVCVCVCVFARGCERLQVCKGGFAPLSADGGGVAHV